MMEDGKMANDKPLCDCLLGFLSDEKIYKSNIDWKLQEIVTTQSNLQDLGFLKGKPLNAKEILDNRRGYISRFNFCPYCAEKINWKSISNSYNK